MECKSKIKKSRVKRLCIECSDCSRGGSLDDPTCMRKILNWLKRNRVDEIQFLKRDFSELYGKKELGILTEIVDIAAQLEENKIWEEVECKLKEDEERYKKFLRDLIKEFYSNPVRAYDILMGVIKQYQMELGERWERKFKYRFRSHRDTLHEHGIESYLFVLEEIKERVEESKLIKAYREGKHKELIKPIIQPVFISSYIDLKLPENSELIDFYQVADSDIRIYKNSGDNIYFVNPPELWLYPEQVGLLTRLNEYISREHSLEVIDPEDARDYFKRIGNENLPRLTNGVSREELEKLSEIFARYSAGYGLLEILFRDKHIYDIYIDSPPGSTPVYVSHEMYGTCVTNIYLMEDDLERLSSKFRAISERPFDEANPILDMDLKEIGIRVAGVREPSTFDGLAYAFRKHRENPWTLARFVQKGMLSSMAAALLSFLISGRCAMLITGARGAGKTSLLSALISEIDQRDRIILMEDTAEIPTTSLRKNGWKIEHLKNQAVISHKRGYELPPEENLRAALRLGESVLILGEVRGPEARVLFEAMRIGAAGNAVLGTIHGSCPYDTWDRITNDLGVPPTSFKAVDIIVSLRYKEEKGYIDKSRRVMEITELRKKWNRNPDEEGAFFDLMRFNEHTEREEFDLENSEIIKDICRRKGISWYEFEELLSIRRRMIDDLVENSREFEDILEIDHVAEMNKRYRILFNESEIHEIYHKWREWFSNYLKELRSRNYARELRQMRMKGIHGS